MNFFSEKELACSCCGVADMDSEFMTKLNLLRNNFGKPIYLSSAYRCPAHNRKEGGRPAHEAGRAVDIAVIGGDALEILGIAVSLGFTGVGIKQHGSGRFVHIDTLQEDEFGDSPRPWVWSYK
jgi:uncharacterized protein YcbK (DUF882 family)